MKLLLWIGNAPHHIALANLLQEKFDVAGIILESRPSQNKNLLSRIRKRLFQSPLASAWKSMQADCRRRHPSLINSNVLNVENINSQAAIDFAIAQSPELVAVSGTRMIKNKMLSKTPTGKILNLHTGLSPYIKGGPNCTNWCLAEQKIHLIGNTVMWIDEGIDSGNLIGTEFTPLQGDEDLNELHIKVMQHAHDLYVRCIGKAILGEANNVDQQSICEGTTYYSRQWTTSKARAAVQNFDQSYRSIFKGDLQKLRLDVKTVDPG